MNQVAKTLPLVDQQASEPLFAIVDEALEILDEEREVFLTGAYDRIASISERKMNALEHLELAIPRARKTAAVIGAIKQLVAASRRNEQIIQAARQGLSHARRRIVAIAEAGRGVVAYAEDGTRIASKADLMKKDRSA